MLLYENTLATEMQQEIQASIQSLAKPPGLAVVLVGNHPSSLSYIKMKEKGCQNVGIDFFFHHLEESSSEKTLLDLIQKLNTDSSIDGILVQSPLPRHINSEKIIQAIDPTKDVDGFHPINIGKLLLGIPNGFIPCTPLGIQTLLLRSHIEIEKQEVVIVGRSNIVGKPLAALLMQNAPNLNATVTVIHSQTQNLISHTRRADILVAAIGSPQFIKEDMVKEGAVVVDVGINRVADPQLSKGYRIVGDVDFNQVEKKCRAITPVPKGVGPMTVTMLLQNTLLSYTRRHT